jgi:hypothetical protein
LSFSPTEAAEALETIRLEAAPEAPGGQPGRGPEAAESDLRDKAALALARQGLEERLGRGGVRVVGRPRLTELEYRPDGGLEMLLEADVLPEASLGPYKGLTVPAGLTAAALAETVLETAAAGMSADIPAVVVERVLDAMAAADRLSAARNPLWHLVADAVAVSRMAAGRLGLARPAGQIGAEALDAALAALAEGLEPAEAKAAILGRIKALMGRYRDLPGDFDETLADLVGERSRRKAAMSAAERTEAAYGAWLGAQGLTVDGWRAHRRAEAARRARHDRLLDAVAEVEGLSATGEEVLEAIRRLALEHDLDLETALAGLDHGPIKERIARDKALRLMIASAVEAREGS